MTELLLGIDIGTASTKAVLADPAGAVVAKAAREHDVLRPRPGHVEHDAEATWWGDVVALCDELLPSTDGNVVAVGVSGIGPCVVPCTADDRPLRPAILYGVDTRAKAEVEELTLLFGEDTILRRCGSRLSSQALGPKLRWLLQHEPDVYANTVRWHMASSFIVARLTGEWVLDHHSASQCDPLYDLAEHEWARDWAEATVPGLPLPRLAWPSEIVGTVHEQGAHATGIPLGTPVIAGAVDAWAEAVSVGVRRPGELMLMYGSTVFLILVADGLLGVETVWTTCGVDRATRTLAAGLATGGALIEWIRTVTGGVPHEELLSAARALPAGSGGLVLLPYFAGERTPILDPDARGAIVGLTLGHTAASLYRAALEGLAYAIRHNLESFPRPLDRAVAVGGGTQSDLWLQIVSDVTGLEQEIPRVTIGASYGDALLAAEGVGLAPPGGSWAVSERFIQPGNASCAVYDDLYGAYRDLYPATVDLQHRLAHLQHDQQGGTDDQ